MTAMTLSDNQAIAGGVPLPTSRSAAARAPGTAKKPQGWRSASRRMTESEPRASHIATRGAEGAEERTVTPAAAVWRSVGCAVKPAGGREVTITCGEYSV